MYFLIFVIVIIVFGIMLWRDHQEEKAYEQIRKHHDQGLYYEGTRVPVRQVKQSKDSDKTNRVTTPDPVPLPDYSNWTPSPSSQSPPHTSISHNHDNHNSWGGGSSGGGGAGSSWTDYGCSSPDSGGSSDSGSSGGSCD